MMGTAGWNGNHDKAALMKQTILRPPSWKGYFSDATMLPWQLQVTGEPRPHGGSPLGLATMSGKEAGWLQWQLRRVRRNQSPDGEDYSSEVAMMEWWALGLMGAPGATHDDPDTMLRQPC